MSQQQIDFYGDPCGECGYRWAQGATALCVEVLALPATYRLLAGHLEGTAGHPDLTWCASAYVLHVGDNLRQHGERMAAAAAGVGTAFRAPDQDELATLRGYERVPLAGALWSLAAIVGPYVEAFLRADAAGAPLPHVVRGNQDALEVLRGNTHDAHHHGWDLARIAEENGTN
jgi:hypothetical protein